MLDVNADPTSEMTPRERTAAKLAEFRAPTETPTVAPAPPAPAATVPPPAPAPVAAPVQPPPAPTAEVTAPAPAVPPKPATTPPAPVDVDKVRAKLMTAEGRLKAEGEQRAKVQREAQELAAKNAALEARLAALEARNAQAPAPTQPAIPNEDAEEAAALEQLSAFGPDEIAAIKRLADARANKAAAPLREQLASIQQYQGVTADDQFTTAVLDTPARVAAVSRPEWDEWASDPANQPAIAAARDSRNAVTMRKLVDRFARETGIADSTTAAPAAPTPPRPSKESLATPANAGRAEGTFPAPVNQPLSISATRAEITRLQNVDRRQALALSRTLTTAMAQGHVVD